MPQTAWSQKRERQYEHIKESLEDQGKSEDLSEEIAARTVNKARARAGESTTASRSSLDDISSSRRGGLPIAQRTGRPDVSTALQGSEGSRHRGTLDDEQVATGARALPR